MIDFPAFGAAISLLAGSPQAWIWVVPGLLIGLVFGALPGISVSMAMALVLPATLYMDFLPAIIFLTSVYTGAGFGGSIPAILINIPGTSSAVATTFDGYPMARKGLHSEALGAALVSSCIGVLISYIILFVLVQPLAEVVLRIGPFEMAAIGIWGLVLLGSIGGSTVAKGLFAAAIGVLCGTVGMNTAGYMRGDMGIPWLLDGVPTIPAMVGLLAASQLFALVNAKFIVENKENRTISLRRILAGGRLVLGSPGTLLRGSAIGVFVGAVPGVGSSIANLISYGETRRSSPDPESYGTGNPRGVIAAESANSSSEGGSMATMLALGIPGGGATAILLAAFAMHNVIGGPRFMEQNRDIVYAIILSNFAQALVLLVIGAGFVFVASTIVRLPLRYLIPTVLVMSTMGAFAIEGSIAGPLTLLAFAVLGWLMSRYGFPVAAIVVGLLLGKLIETEMLRAYQLAGGDAVRVLDYPVAVGIILLMIVSLALSLRRDLRRRAALKTDTAAAVD
ncbi:tripartite tricarboxylate transporter permease [Falsiroseomonas sp.]|uniref:tripartite tricarboxylate transporter permease n=1 Tax=Falsiroseomonas sp. TaxID=2870721 RepID=UPI002721E901|nr:tripartite tricarboxylate transporter permease [Falsiroseomonas sp.]MDO9499990.1 tripartite tricarboxylate transporter permease [Falsiroseomonas sp.]